MNIHLSHREKKEKDTTRPNEALDELSSYVGISGLGLTLGLKYSL